MITNSQTPHTGIFNQFTCFSYSSVWLKDWFSNADVDSYMKIQNHEPEHILYFIISFCASSCTKTTEMKKREKRTCVCVSS